MKRTTTARKQADSLRRERRPGAARLPFAALVAGFLLAAAPLFVFTSCGSDNVFEPLQKKSDKDKAKNALASGDWDKAIDSLEAYLRDHPDDAEARAMLANAYLMKTGVDPLRIGSAIADAQKNGITDFKALAGAMPAGTAENVEALENAVAALSEIPPEDRTKEQNYQLAVAQASLAVTMTKKVATDDSGNVDDAKVAQMSEAEADSIVNGLNGTASAIAATGEQSDGNASKLSNISSQVNSQEGATNKERLTKYLSK